MNRIVLVVVLGALLASCNAAKTPTTDNPAPQSGKVETLNDQGQSTDSNSRQMIKAPRGTRKTPSTAQ